MSISRPSSSGRARSVAAQDKKSSMRAAGSSHASSRPTWTRRLVKSGSSSASSPRTSSREAGFVGSIVIGARVMPKGSTKPSGAIASDR